MNKFNRGRFLPDVPPFLSQELFIETSKVRKFPIPRKNEENQTRNKYVFTVKSIH